MLKELEERESQLRKELDEVQTAIRDTKLEAAKRKYCVRIGSIVKNRKGKEFRVTHIDAHWDGPPWLEGNPRRKDGTFGTAKRNLFSYWEVITT